MAWYEFSQNNSSVNWVIDDQKGLGPRVWIEATSVEMANIKAEQLGIYFDGVDKGMDCACCGDRWSQACENGFFDPVALPNVDPEYDFYWHNTVYAHRLNGEIVRIKKNSPPFSA